MELAYVLNLDSARGNLATMLFKQFLEGRVANNLIRSEAIVLFLLKA